MGVDRPGDHFLAGAAFAGQQNGRVAFAHRVDGVQHPPKAWAVADQAVDLPVFVELGAHALVVFEDVAKLQGLVDGDVQLIDVERLGDVVEGAVAHRLHGVFHRAVGGHDDHR
ncbi:hypothetical protein D3C84_858960 [compost metagenome]